MLDHGLRLLVECPEAAPQLIHGVVGAADEGLARHLHTPKGSISGQNASHVVEQLDSNPSKFFNNFRLKTGFWRLGVLTP